MPVCQHCYSGSCVGLYFYKIEINDETVQKEKEGPAKAGATAQNSQKGQERFRKEKAGWGSAEIGSHMGGRSLRMIFQNKTLPLFCVFLLWTSWVEAQDHHFTNPEVRVQITEDYLNVSTTGYPDHPWEKVNPNRPSKQNFNFKIPRGMKANEEDITRAPHGV